MQQILTWPMEVIPVYNLTQIYIHICLTYIQCTTEWKVNSENESSKGETWICLMWNRIFRWKLTELILYSWANKLTHTNTFTIISWLKYLVLSSVKPHFMHLINLPNLMACIFQLVVLDLVIQAHEGAFHLVLAKQIVHIVRIMNAVTPTKNKSRLNWKKLKR